MRKQCVPGVSPPPSQTPGYEAIYTHGFRFRARFWSHCTSYIMTGPYVYFDYSSNMTVLLVSL